MKNCGIILNVFFAQFLILTVFIFEAKGQNDNVNGIWSGTVTMRQTYTGEFGNSVLEIITNFTENRGRGSMTFEGEWKSPGLNHKISSDATR